MWRRRRRQLAVEPLPDGLPKRGLFTEPIVVTKLEALDPDLVEGEQRVRFLVEVRDAEGRRCPDVAVEARIAGPHRQAKAMGTTDMFGRVRFRMTGPGGSYGITLLDVGAGGLDWDRAAGPQQATTDVEPSNAH